MSNHLKPLRTAASLPDDAMGGFVTVRTADLRALIADYDEVTDLTGPLTPEVLTRLSDVQGYVRTGYFDSLAAVLAKAGGK
jgi:hypothetical protein